MTVSFKQDTPYNVTVNVVKGTLRLDKIFNNMFLFFDRQLFLSNIWYALVGYLNEK